MTEPLEASLVPEDMRPSTHPLRQRPFQRYLVGFGGSLFADGLWFVALSWAASQLDNSFQTSLVMAVGSIPRALLLIFGGVLADRWGALRTVLVTQRLRLLVMTGFAATATVAPPNVALLCVTAGLFGVLDAFHMPAAGALPPSLLDRDTLPAGQGLVQTLERLSLVAAASAGGAIIGVWDVAGVALVSAVVLLAALPPLMGLRRSIAPAAGGDSPAVANGETQHESRPGLRQALSGIRFAVNNQVVGPVLFVVTIVNLALMPPLNVGLPLLASEHGWTPSQFGVVLSCFGAGAALGALSVLAWRPKRPALAGLLWVAAGAVGLATLGTITQPLAAAAVAALLGFTAGPASALLLGLVQALTPAEYMGRVMALVAFSALGLVPVGYVAFGALAELLGLQATFILCATGELIALGAALLRRPVRDARL